MGSEEVVERMTIKRAVIGAWLAGAAAGAWLSDTDDARIARMDRPGGDAPSAVGDAME